MKTHRCEGSLKHNCSIRYNHKTWIENAEGWWLLILDFDLDYDWIGLSKVTPIDYCPFCGSLLENI